MAWALVGPPTAWVVAMPVIGVVGATSWRLAFAVPLTAAGVAAIALRRAPVASSSRSEPGLRTVLAERALRGWAIGEVLAYAAWSGVLVYSGALFVESYGTSLVAVGLALGVGAAAYIPGTFLAQRVIATRGRPLLAATGALLAPCVVAFGVLRLGTVSSAIGFGVLCFLAGGRTYLGSAVGLELAPATGTPQPCRFALQRLRSVGSSAPAPAGPHSRSAAIRRSGSPLARSSRRVQYRMRVPSARSHDEGVDAPLSRHRVNS